MFWIPLFKVTMELGQLVQEPCSFSLTMPSSNPRYRTSPPSSCTVGLGSKKNVKHVWTWRGSHGNGGHTLILECSITSSYLIRVSSSSLIIATTSSSSSDGAEKTSGDSLALTNSSPSCVYCSVLICTAGWNPDLYLHSVCCPH